MTGGVFAAAPLVFLGEAGLGEAHELIEDCEFEFQFDGVDHGFDGGFADVIVCEFQADEDDVHADAYAIDEEELEHDFAGHAVVDAAEEAHGGGDVDGGDDEFLEAETDELDAFHDVEFRGPEAGVGGVGAVGEDYGGEVESYGVEDYHGEDVAEGLLVADYEM